jgi:glycosyltransferase involved in cell wall biosynthesis
MDKPLISFVIWCYNQEAFIREAIQGAFSQNYSPLEIIISDDCSDDRTFDIVRDMAAAYSGPHKLRLCRNPRNLGIGGNLNRAVGLARGELLVMAGGDDISLPQRTRRLVEAWDDSGRRATTLYSSFVGIDERGAPISGLGLPEPNDRSHSGYEEVAALTFARRRRPAFGGGTQAISPKLFSIFGPLPERIWAEDTALAFRTALIGGGFTFVNAPLVKGRRHGANNSPGAHLIRPRDAASFREFQHKRHAELCRMVGVYDSFAADAVRAEQQGLISPAEYVRLKSRILGERRRFKLRSDLLVQVWWERTITFCKLYSFALRPRELLESSPHLLPRALHCAGVIARNRICL